MKSSSRMAIAAIALLSGISAAAAAGNGASKTGADSSAIHRAMPTDNLVLSQKQQKIAWQDISKLGAKEAPPSGFNAMIGAQVPSKLDTHPVPVSTANKVPLLRPYQYALLNTNKLLIVNPNDKKIAGIITQ